MPATGNFRIGGLADQRRDLPFGVPAAAGDLDNGFFPREGKRHGHDPLPGRGEPCAVEVHRAE
jgi:hypothetical protein